MTATVFTLPWPVSVNRTYRSVAGRSILSKDARAWKTAASISIMSQRQHIRPHTGKVRIMVELCAPDKRRRDCDNPLKLVLDAIVDAGIIPSDDNRTVREVTARWVDLGPPCTVTITSLGPITGGQPAPPADALKGEQP